MRKFFVYGTLMVGMSNHGIIPNGAIEKVEEASIKNMDLYAFGSGSFPCMLPGENIVKGQLITVREKAVKDCLFFMDRLEGYDENADKEDNFYNREIKSILLSSGESVEAYTYVYNRKFNGGLMEQIREGDFRLWKTQSR